MNRRNFLKRLGIGLAVAGGVAALPKILNPSVPTTSYSTYIVGENAIFNGHNLTLADVRAAKESLIKMQVKPSNGGFVGWVHPYVIDDIRPIVKYKYTVTAAPPVRGQRLRFVDAA